MPQSGMKSRDEAPAVWVSPADRRYSSLTSEGIEGIPADLDTDDLAPVRAALDAILRQQEPFPAVVMSSA